MISIIQEITFAKVKNAYIDTMKKAENIEHVRKKGEQLKRIMDKRKELVYNKNTKDLRNIKELSK